MFAGAPCHSQPTRPGLPSPFFMPVPSNNQWFSVAQVQSASPIVGCTVRLPSKVPSSSPHDLKRAISGKLSRSALSTSPKTPSREKTRFGTLELLEKNGISPRQVSELRKATFTPAATADLALSNI